MSECLAECNQLEEMVLMYSPSTWWEVCEGFLRGTGITSIGVSGGRVERYVG